MHCGYLIIASDLNRTPMDIYLSDEFELAQGEQKTEPDIELLKESEISEESDFPWWIILITLIVTIILITVIFLILKQKKQKPSQTPQTPPEEIFWQP